MKKNSDKVSLERLKSKLDYDPETGLFTRNGKLAGTHDRFSTGYIQIQIDGKIYYAHRLAWYYCHGVWPTGVIDHIDGNKINNSLKNLRDCCQSTNGLNQKGPRADNKSGYLGVVKDSRRKKKPYRAEIRINGRGYWLGSFETAYEASLEYLRAKHLWMMRSEDDDIRDWLDQLETERLSQQEEEMF